MKNLIRIQAFLLVLFASLQLSAQTYMLKGGLNLSELRMANSNEFIDNSILNPGFHIGGSIILPVYKKCSIDLGLQFTSKGLREEYYDEYEGIIMSGKLIANLYYLEVPVKLKFTQNFNQIGVYGAFGPYIGLGLSGRVTSEFTEDGKTIASSDDIEFGDDGLNRLDGGLVFEVGLEYQRFLVGLNYTMGLIDIDNGSKTTNHVYSLSLGYKFGS